MARVALVTLGCKVNQYETEVIEGLFKQHGYDVVSFTEPADIYVINTCSVTHLGERKSRQLIRRATRLNPAGVVVVTGCYAQISPEEVQAIPGVDVIVGTQNRHNIVKLAQEALKTGRQVNSVGSIMHAEHFEDIPLFALPGRTRAFLKIQEGCTNYCTYCIIPYARGPLRSRSLSSIENEVSKLVAAGFKEIVLTGIHLGAYGRDLANNITLADAVKTVLKNRGIVRLRLSSLESIEISDELIELTANEPKLCKHLHLPLQSGDDQVLLRMNRHYTIAEYKTLISNIRERIGAIAITTDIIVGFPGETEEMFEHTLKVVEQMEFAGVHVFPYSRRSGTPAADYPDQVPEPIKKVRGQRLQAMAAQQAIQYASRFIGHRLSVLFEAEHSGIINGLTGNYIKIYTHGDSQMAGNIFSVKAKKLYQDGLWGELID